MVWGGNQEWRRPEVLGAVAGCVGVDTGPLMYLFCAAKNLGTLYRCRVPS